MTTILVCFGLILGCFAGILGWIDAVLLKRRGDRLAWELGILRQRLQDVRETEDR